MSWAVRTGNGGGSRWVKWVDDEAAMAHLRVLRSEVSRADTAQLMGDQRAAEVIRSAFGSAERTGLGLSAEEWLAWRIERYQAQVLRCRTVAQSLEGFGLACDLDVFGLAPYAPGRIAGDDGGRDVPGLYAEFGAWRSALVTLLATRPSAVRDALSHAGGDLLLDLYPRVDFDAAGHVAVREDVIDPDSGRDATDYVTDDPGGWNPWSGWLVKSWSPGGGAASGRVEVTALVPLSLSWALLERAGRFVAARGLDRTLGLCAGWVAARNARLSRQLGGGGLPRAIVEASAAADVAALGGGEVPEETARLLATAEGLLASGDPGAGITLGMLAGLGGVLALIVAGPRRVAEKLRSAARGVAVDAWGHRQPFLQRLDYTGRIADRTAPTHAIPPPAYATAPNPTKGAPPRVRYEALDPKDVPRVPWQQLYGDDKGRR